MRRIPFRYSVSAHEILIHKTPRHVPDRENTTMGIVRCIIVIVETENLHPPGKGLVSPFLLPALFQFISVSPRNVGYPWRSSPSRLRDIHMVQPVVLYSFVVEPWTITALPFDAADHAEFSLASARHVIAAFLELDRGRAVVTSLPAFQFGDLGKSCGRFVFGTILTVVPFSVAHDTYLCPAAAAFPVFPSGVCAARSVQVDICRFNPLATALGGTINAILRCVFLIFPIPFHLELQVEQLVHVFQGDVVYGAAFRRHVGRICNGHCKDAPKARMAHAMATG